MGMKEFLFGAAEKLLLNNFSRRVFKNSLVVLCYHGVVEKGRQKDRTEQTLYVNTVSIPEFDAQLEYVSKHFHPISAADLVGSLTEDRRLPAGAVLITFDDGYRNNATHAAPILLKRGIPAIFHLATGYIGSRSILWTEEIRLRSLEYPGNILKTSTGLFHLAGDPSSYQRLIAACRVTEACKVAPVEVREELLRVLRLGTPALPSRYDPEAHDFMNWEEARKLASQGFALGSHTVSHSILTQLPGCSAATELGESRAAVEQHTGARCNILAYPNGSPKDYSEPVMEVAQQAEYSAAFSVEDRLAGPRPRRFAIPRLMVPGHVSQTIFRAKVSGLYLLRRHKTTEKSIVYT